LLEDLALETKMGARLRPTGRSLDSISPILNLTVTLPRIKRGVLHPNLFPLFQVLALVAVANGVPVLAKKVMGERYARPIDGGFCLNDGRPLLGSSKTMRGAVLSIVVTSITGPVVGLDVWSGFLAGFSAMGGDLLSSFAKRRLGLQPSSMAPGVDQVPESLLPLLALRGRLGLTWIDVVLGVAAFWLGELVLSRVLFVLKIRDRPY
jgi:hypothetical protein